MEDSAEKFDNDMTIAFRANLYSNLCAYHNNCTKQLTKLKEFINSLPQDIKHKDIAQSQYLFMLFSHMENFFTESAIDFLTAYPCKIQKAKIDRNEVLGRISLTDFIKYFAQKQIYEIAYKPLGDYLRHVYELFGANIDDFFSDTSKKEILIEAKARRDVFMHNGGKVSYLYVQRTKECSSRALKLDDEASLDDVYLSEIETVITELVKDFFDKCVEKYKKDTKANVFKTMWEKSSLNKLVEFDTQWGITPTGDLFMRDYEWGWSGTETKLFNFFRQIHSSEGPSVCGKEMNIRDIGLSLYWWKGYPDERIIQSWLESPFWF